MHYNLQGIQVFLEKKRTRQLVGILTCRKEGGFNFEYDDHYLRAKNVISLGPEMPLTRKRYESPTLFIPFVDRIPSQRNPAYPEYCEAMGISEKEQNVFVLLSTIARKGPSSFIFEPLYRDDFLPKDLIAYRKSLGLTVREFAECFEFSSSAISKIEKGHASGSDVLKRVAIYAKYPQVAFDQLQIKGSILHSEKRRAVERTLKS